MVYTLSGKPVKLYITGAGLSSSVGTSTIVTSTGQVAYTTETYSSTSPSARVYEQIFTQQADPRPMTEDWTNFICQFDPTQYDEFSARCEAVIYSPDSGSSISPLVRAFYPPSSTGLSARLPVDGLNTGFDWGYKYYDYSTNTLDLIASTNKWYPMSAIVGSATEPMLAAVCAYNPLFGTTRSQWASGLCSALPTNCKFSGTISFRKAMIDTSNSTASSTSIVYNSSETSTVTDFCSDQTGRCTVSFNLDPHCFVCYSAYSGNMRTASGILYNSGSSSINVPAGTKLFMTASSMLYWNKFYSIDTAFLANSMDDLEATGMSASIHPYGSLNEKYYTASAIINHKAELDWRTGDEIPFTAEYSANLPIHGYSSNYTLALVSASFPLCGEQSALLLSTPNLKAHSVRRSAMFTQGYKPSWTGEYQWGLPSVSSEVKDTWTISASANSSQNGESLVTQISDLYSSTLSLTQTIPSSTARSIYMLPYSTAYNHKWYGNLDFSQTTYRYKITGYL